MIQVTLEKLSLEVKERSIYGLSFVLENDSINPNIIKHD